MIARRLINSLVLTLPPEEGYYRNPHFSRRRADARSEQGSGSAEHSGHRAQRLAESEHTRIT